MKEYETKKGLAELLGVSYSTIRRRAEEFGKVAPATAYINDGQIQRIHTESFIKFWAERILIWESSLAFWSQSLTITLLTVPVASAIT